MIFSRYVKVALFFIALGVTGSIYVIVSADGLSDFNTKVYEVVLPDATGLSTRSKVYLAGVAVGRVRGITLENNEARLKVAFLKNVEIRKDSRISRRASSILGTSVLNLEPGTELSPILLPGTTIPADKNAADITAVLGLVQEMGGQLTQLIRDFQDNQLALLSVSLETFNSIAGKINAQSDAELERVSRILESTALITERLERLLAEGEMAGTGPAGDVYGALENIRRITDEIRQGQGNIGQAVYDDQLYAGLLATVQRTEEAVIKLQTALDNINSLAKTADGVVADAGVIVKKAMGLGVEVDAYGRYDVMAEQMRAGASLRLVPASNDRWYRIGVASAPDGIVYRTVKETTDNSGARSVEDTTETRYSFSVDAELARRFGMITLHGGLLENTGGVGIDIQPVRWVNLSGEVFNFRKGEKPNLRGTLTVYPFFDPGSNKPWNWIYLRGGVSNALVDDRDYFVGGGLRFTDTEIKGLVGLIPVLNN
ncbi:MAG: MlaD family protein [Treponema sp.]|jgi:phospholipid/cholesterol/gamma-HCH transport system substrate-binding protein|nr:MlaD family protein [Treponema sp.]